MTKHKTEDCKFSAVKYCLNNEKGDGYKKRVKYLIVRKPLYVIGVNDTIFLKILQQKPELIFLITSLIRK